MMVASLDLCKELHAVSGWEGTAFSWYCDEERDDDPALNLSEPLKVLGGVGYFDHKYPAYDLGYLMRMLPGHYIQKLGNGDFTARWTMTPRLNERHAVIVTWLIIGAVAGVCLWRARRKGEHAA